jgi:predicted O-linked N-acetylglucosamine transferase (SPINDLY family)
MDAIARIEDFVRLGLLDAAQAACRELIAQTPQEHRAWALLGAAAIAGGRPAEAEPALRQAVALAPQQARYWNHLSLGLRLLGKPVEAESAARQAVALADISEHWAGLGNCLFHQARWSDAADAYQQALRKNPNDAEVWSNLGAARQSIGQSDAAEQALLRALNLAPDDPNANTRFALLEIQRGEIGPAIERIKRVLARSPQVAAMWLVLGHAERLIDHLPQAVAAYRRALELAPNDRDVRYNLALVQLQCLAAYEAEMLAGQLVAENPQDAAAWTVLGGALHAQARMDGAVFALRRSVEVEPYAVTHSKLLVGLHYDASIGPEQMLAEHRRWDAAYAQPVTAASRPGVVRAMDDGLRIGFVGLDFNRGPSGFLALRGLECLDKSRCDVVGYCDLAWEDAYTVRFRAASNIWRMTMGLSDEELAEQVRRDEIDVLVDLGGHVGRRLLAFARRPAPLQITWLGYVGTTGLSTMDGLLADRFHIRPGEEAWYSEKVLRMPNDYVCYGPPTNAAEIGPLPARQHGEVTFGCFNNPAKFSQQTLDAWGSILRRVPRARMFLKYGGLDDPRMQNRIRKELADRGVSTDRIQFEGWSEHADLLSRYNQIDLALDTQPYSGGLTTCEALWMGVPVITWPGRGFASRHSTSHVTNAGYGEFVAADVGGYMELAVQWARRSDELATIRAAMRDRVRQSPLCDAPRFASDLLALLKEAWANKG